MKTLAEKRVVNSFFIRKIGQKEFETPVGFTPQPLIPLQRIIIFSLNDAGGFGYPVEKTPDGLHLRETGNNRVNAQFGTVQLPGIIFCLFQP